MDFLGVGMLEILVILLIAMLVLGPAKSIKMATGAGKMLGQVRRAMMELSQAVEAEEREIEQGRGHRDKPNIESSTPPEERR